MKNKIKIFSAILSGILLLSPVSELINQENSIANAAYSQKVVSKEPLSYEETSKIIDDMLLSGKITEDRHKELHAMILQRGANGWPYKVRFSDGAYDLHIPGWMVVTGGVITSATVGYFAAAYGGFASAIYGGGTQLAGILNANNIENIRNNGIVLYFRPQQTWECDESGHYCNDITFYRFQHARIDW